MEEFHFQSMNALDVMGEFMSAVLVNQQHNNMAPSVSQAQKETAELYAQLKNMLFNVDTYDRPPRLDINGVLIPPLVLFVLTLLFPRNSFFILLSAVSVTASIIITLMFLVNPHLSTLAMRLIRHKIRESYDRIDWDQLESMREKASQYISFATTKVSTKVSAWVQAGQAWLFREDTGPTSVQHESQHKDKQRDAILIETYAEGLFPTTLEAYDTKLVYDLFQGTVWSVFHDSFKRVITSEELTSKEVFNIKRFETFLVSPVSSLLESACELYFNAGIETFDVGIFLAIATPPQKMLRATFAPGLAVLKRCIPDEPEEEFNIVLKLNDPDTKLSVSEIRSIFFWSDAVALQRNRSTTVLSDIDGTNADAQADENEDAKSVYTTSPRSQLSSDSCTTNSQPDSDFYSSVPDLIDISVFRDRVVSAKVTISGPPAPASGNHLPDFIASSMKDNGEKNFAYTPSKKLLSEELADFKKCAIGIIRDSTIFYSNGSGSHIDATFVKEHLDNQEFHFLSKPKEEDLRSVIVAASVPSEEDPSWLCITMDSTVEASKWFKSALELDPATTSEMQIGATVSLFLRELMSKNAAFFQSFLFVDVRSLSIDIDFDSHQPMRGTVQITETGMQTLLSTEF